MIVPRSGRFLHGKKRLAGNKPVVHGPVPGVAAFPLADNDVDAVVAHIQCLSRPLDPVAENGDGFLF